MNITNYIILTSLFRNKCFFTTVYEESGVHKRQALVQCKLFLTAESLRSLPVVLMLIKIYTFLWSRTLSTFMKNKVLLSIVKMP